MQSEPNLAVRQLTVRYLRLFLGLSAIAWGSIFLAVFVLHEGYPRNSYLFDPRARFTDFTIYLDRFIQYGATPGFFTASGHFFAYPAPCFFVYLLFTRMSSQPLALFLITIVSSIPFAATVFYRQVAGIGTNLAILLVASSVILSYPFHFLLDRGSTEGIIWIFVLAGLISFIRQNNLLAALCFGLAAALKLIPALLLLLLIKRRRYKELLAGLAAGALLTIVCLSSVGMDLFTAQKTFAAGLQTFHEVYAVRYRASEIGFDHSLFGLIKQILVFSTLDVAWVERTLPSLARVYAAVTIGGFVLLYLFRIRKLPILNQLFALVIAMCTLPYVSYDYKLVHLYLPFSCLIIYLAHDVSSTHQSIDSQRLFGLLWPCAVLFTPQSYLALPFVGFGGQVKAVVLMILLYRTLQFPLPTSLFGESRSDESR